MTALPTWLQPELSWPVALVLKATLVLAGAAAVAFVLERRRASAAARHLVWLLAVVGLLALPVLAAALPRWRIPIATAPQITVTAVVLPANLANAPASASPDVGATAPAPAVNASSPAPAVSSGGWTLPRIRLEQALAFVYALGVLLLLARLAAGRWVLSRLRRSAAALDSVEWADLLEEASDRLRLRRSVTLLRARAATMPMTWGTRRPVVLLPADAEEWPEERRRVVLLHELAHVARGDCLTQTLAALASALYWFHPGAWHAARRLRVERERASDDRVLAAGTRPRSYAQHLLDVASVFRAAPLTGALAVSMARPSQLEGRMLAVLDAVRSRRAPSRRAVLGTTAMVLGALAVLAVATPSVMRAAGMAGGEAPRPASPALTQVDDAPVQDNVVERTLRVREGGTLRLDLETGGELEIVGWDRGEVQLRAELRGRDWRGTRVELEPDGGGARVASRHVGSNRSYSTSHRFALRVPRSYSVRVESGGGGIRLRELRGSFTGNTGGGALRLERLSGRVALTTGGGDVHVADSRLDGDVRTGGGDVILENVEGGVRGYTGSGDVVNLHGNVERGDYQPRDGVPIDMDRAGGAIRIDSAPFGAKLSTGGGDIRVRSARSFVHARTGGGDIVLMGIDGSITASTGSGDLTVEMVGDADRGSRDVEITSGSGDVTLTLPAGIDADFDIETAYTNNAPGRVTIRSDFPLRMSESRDWEGVNRGTPRKYVRGAGTTGSGRHRIRIHTVNGNVRIIRGGGRAAASLRPSAEGLVNDRLRTAADRDAARQLEHEVFAKGDVRSLRESTRELGTLGDVAAPALHRIAREHPSSEAREEAVLALGRIAGDDAIATLRHVITRDPDATVQRRAVEALAATIPRTDVARSTHPAQIANALREIARTHPNPRVRERATDKLDDMDDYADRAG
ncbi:MAG TPA: M56 family metallopeptidase [Longimicrobium sp.]|nr:M56 family metallopeptidase [Longimicrobium sp.]